MNKLFNWTFGGFFRSLGRILCYVLVGALISFILSKSGVKISDILGIAKVNASTIIPWSTNQVKINTCGPSSCEDSSNYDGNHTFSGSAVNNPVHFIQWRLKSSDGLSTANSYTFTFGFKPTPDAIAVNGVPTFKKTGDYEVEEISCSTKSNNGYYLWTCTFTPREDYSSSEYLYVRITFYDSYLTSLVSSMTGYEVLKGTTTVITEQTNMIDNTIKEESQTIVNNITNNFDDLKDFISSSNMSCRFTSNSIIVRDGYYLTSNGSLATNDTWASSFGVTDYLDLKDVKKIYKITNSTQSDYSCFYDNNKNFISCIANNDASIHDVSIPNNASYFRFSIFKTMSVPVYSICLDTNSATLNEVDEIKDILDDDDISSSQQEASDFFGDFTTDTHGLTGIITAPLNLIRSLTSASCQRLGLLIPFVNEYLYLPCMTDVYEENFGDILTIYQLITDGVIAYWVCVRVFAYVKDFKNPDHDEIEVVDL